MKKLLALSIISLFSLNCMAWHHKRTIEVNNNTEETIEARDTSNHSVTVEPGRSVSLNIKVKENRGTLIPSLLMPYVTKITVSDDEGSNTIEVDENTQSITVEDGLQLSKD